MKKVTFIFFVFSSKKLILTLLPIFSITLLYPQTNKIDSLRSVITNKVSTLDQYTTLYDLTYELIDINNEEALHFAIKAKSLAETLGDSLRMVMASRLEASTLRRLERIDESIQISIRALQISKRNNFTEEVKVLLNSTALAYALKAEYDKALRLHFESLVIREKEGSKSQISISLNNIGFIYFKLRNWEKAIKYYDQSLALKRLAGDTYDIEPLLINIGLCYIQLKRFPESEQYINQGLEFCEEKCEDNIIIEAYFGMGLSLYGQEKYDQALRFFTQSLSKSRQTGSHRFQAENLVYLGRIGIVSNDNFSAKKYLTEAEKLALSAGYNELLIDVYKQFSLFYGKLNDFKNSSGYLNKYIVLKDSIHSYQLIENLARVESDFAERENIAKLNHQEEVLALKEESISRKNVMIALISFSTFLITIIAFLLFRSNKSRKITNELLENKIKERTHQLQESHSQLMHQLDDKSKEVKKAHTELTSLSATLKGIVNIGKNESDPPTLNEYFNEVDKAVDQIKGVANRYLNDKE